jgi:hypothetical protein
LNKNTLICLQKEKGNLRPNDSKPLFKPFSLLQPIEGKGKEEGDGSCIASLLVV